MLGAVDVLNDDRVGVSEEDVVETELAEYNAEAVLIWITDRRWNGDRLRRNAVEERVRTRSCSSVRTTS